MASNPPEQRPGRPAKPGGPQNTNPNWRWLALIAGFLILAVLILPSLAKSSTRKTMPYGEFISNVQEGKVASAKVNNDNGYIAATLADKTKVAVNGPHPLTDSQVNTLKDKVKDLQFDNSQSNFLVSLLPLLLYGALFIG